MRPLPTWFGRSRLHLNLSRRPSRGAEPRLPPRRARAFRVYVQSQPRDPHPPPRASSASSRDRARHHHRRRRRRRRRERRSSRRHAFHRPAFHHQTTPREDTTTPAAVLRRWKTNLVLVGVVIVVVVRSRVRVCVPADAIDGSLALSAIFVAFAASAVSRLDPSAGTSTAGSESGVHPPRGRDDEVSRVVVAAMRPLAIARRRRRPTTPFEGSRLRRSVSSRRRGVRFRVQTPRFPPPHRSRRRACAAR